MSASTTLPISEARKNIFAIAEAVQRPPYYYILTENGRPKVVMMSVDEFESWVETLAVANEFPDLKKDMVETRRAFKSGVYKQWASLEELLEREGFLNVKAFNTYEVSGTPKTKRAKRVR